MPELADIPVTDLAHRLTQAIQLERAYHVELLAQDAQRLTWRMRWKVASAAAGPSGDGPGADD